MDSYKQEVDQVVKSIICNSEMLIKQAKMLEQACKSNDENYDELYSVMHSIMDYSNNIDTKIGEMSLIL